MFEYAVRKGAEFVAAFTYPMSTTRVDKAWEASPGIRFAQCVKDATPSRFLIEAGLVDG